jgi:hypothetical protein
MSDRQYFRDALASNDFVVSNYLIGRLIRFPYRGFCLRICRKIVCAID